MEDNIKVHPTLLKMAILLIESVVDLCFEQEK